MSMTPDSMDFAGDPVERVRQALLPLADAARAVQMRAYMRERFDFLGIQTPARRAAVAPVLRSMRKAPASRLLSYAKEFWRQPQREFQYVAIDLLAGSVRSLIAADAATRGSHPSTASVAPLLALARRKSWWDTVDGLAGVVGTILEARHRVDPRCQASMDEALRDEDFWIRRVAMLHQLGWKGQTDTRRLFSYATHLAPEREFFIRKAIGWALRDFARHDPDAVRRFLAQAGDRLSPLTRREAGKHL